MTGTDQNSLTVINAVDNTTAGSIPVGASSPGALAVAPNGTRVYVANSGSSNVSVIDATDNTQLGTVNVGASPSGVAITPNNTRVYVANSGSSNVSVIDATGPSILATVPVGVSPSGVAVAPNNTRVYVTNQGGNTVSVIDTASNTVVATVSVGAAPGSIVVTPDSTRVYLLSSTGTGVVVLSTLTNTVSATIPTTDAADLAITPDGSRIYVSHPSQGTVTVLDTASNTFQPAALPAGATPTHLAVTRDGAALYATQPSSAATVLSTATGTVTGSVPVTGALGGVATGTVPKTVSTTSLMSSDNPSLAGQPVTLTATVTGTDGGTPTGSVAFSDGGAPLGTVALTGTPSQAVLTTSALGPGDHEIRATYNGSAVYAGGQAVPLVQAVGQSPVFTSGAATTFGIGVPASFTVTTDGLPAPVFSPPAGALPAGVTFTDNGDGTADLAGTPSAGSEGSYPFTLTATNTVGSADQAFTLTVVTSGALAISTSALPDAQVDVPYSAAVAAGGGTPPYTWSITAAALPPGLSLDPATGDVTGTPSAPGSTALTFQVTDTDGQSASRTVTIVVLPAELRVTTTTLPQGSVGNPYTTTLTSAGGTPPVTWAVTTGSLPPGLTLNPTSGVLGGTPTAVGTVAFTVTATDNGTGGNQQNAAQALSITTLPPPLTPTSTALPTAMVGAPYTAFLTATGGIEPYTWTALQGVLPPGLTLHPDTGIIDGTPAVAGVSALTFQVTDGAATTATQDLGLTVAPSELTATSPQPPDAVAGTPYTAFLTALGGTPPYTWAVVKGTLPAGLILHPGTGTVDGTPTVAGKSDLTFQVTDSAAVSATQNLTITVLDGAKPHVSTSVTVSAPGADFLVEGVAMPPNQAVTVRLSAGPEARTVTTGADGALSVRFSVYPKSPSGVRTLQVFIAGVAQPVATSALLVASGSLVPPDFNARH
ncbi:putative Ig domain-containing protein (plasmid) [Kitasatospora sp. NBC_00070]|uniref:putative Ig domain-containing protein n=1 Tax=Kitasatospora sp. NBC_00070 TaxID=2975962 RepID=UPI00324D068F